STLALSDLPATLTAGEARDVTVKALDYFGNTATSYRGTVHFSSGDPQAVLPDDYTFTAADNGVHVFRLGVALHSAGVQSVTVRDAATSALASSVSVNGPVNMSRYTIPTPNSDLFDITVGPDGNLWFTERTGNKIGRITRTGVITGEFPVPTPDS